MGWQETLRELWRQSSAQQFGEATSDSATLAPEPQFLPNGSPLADSVRKAVQEELTAQSERANKDALERQLRRQFSIEDDERRRGEIKEGLQNTFTNLGVIEVLQDVRDHVWGAGEIAGPTINDFSVDPQRWNRGEIFAALEFVYDDIAMYETKDQRTTDRADCYRVTRHHIQAKRKETLRIGIKEEGQESRPKVGGTSSRYAVEVTSRSGFINAPDELKVKVELGYRPSARLLLSGSEPNSWRFGLTELTSATSQVNEIIKQDSIERFLNKKLPGQLAVDGAERIKSLAGKTTQRFVYRERSHSYSGEGL